MPKKLILLLERSRAIFKNALSSVIAETKLPAYLIEGILLDLLNDIRAQKAQEFAAEYEEALRLIPSAPISDPEKPDTIQKEEGEKPSE